MLTTGPRPSPSTCSSAPPSAAPRRRARRSSGRGWPAQRCRAAPGRRGVGRDDDGPRGEVAVRGADPAGSQRCDLDAGPHRCPRAAPGASCSGTACIPSAGTDGRPLPNDRTSRSTNRRDVAPSALADDAGEERLEHLVPQFGGDAAGVERVTPGLVRSREQVGGVRRDVAQGPRDEGGGLARRPQRGQGAHEGARQQGRRQRGAGRPAGVGRRGSRRRRRPAAGAAAGRAGPARAGLRGRRG